jgi:hypothetical protein
MKQMRLVLLAIFMLFAGCLAQEAAVPATQNQTSSQDAALQANISAPEPEISANLTIAAADGVQMPANETNPAWNPEGNESSPGNNETQNPEPVKPPDGLVFGNGSYVLAFDDASVIPASSEPCGIFSLWAANGSLIEKMFICPGESEIWRSPDDSSYRIRVVQVAAPYSGSGAWAKVIVFG